MELDDMKAAWQALDRRLALDAALRLDDLRERKLGHVRSSLRPLFWGQIAQIVFGVLMILLGVSAWRGGIDQTGLFVAGIVMHVYGVLTVIAGGSTLGMIGSIDYAEPVLKIQQRLLALRRWYVFTGAVVGLSWWLLWIPFMICLSRGAPWFLLPSTLALTAGIGIAGLLATWLFHRWLRRPGRERLAQAASDSAAGRSIKQAQSALSELAQFSGD